MSDKNQPGKEQPAKTVKRSTKTLAGQVTAAADSERKKLISLYDKAVKLAQTGQFDKAHVSFNEMLSAAPPELADRIRMYISTCVARIDRGTTEFRSHEEHYDFAISLLNSRDYVQAHKELNEILLHDSTADYAFYGLAVLASMTGQHDDCIRHLREAIRLNPRNRLQAITDTDFADIADHPGFTELLYPEA